MRKTVFQIADQVLEKLATSRWREAIRSGELAPREAETLKTRMGVDPLREAGGLRKKWEGIANYHKFAPFQGDIYSGTHGDSTKNIKLLSSASPISKAQHQQALLKIHMSRIFDPAGAGVGPFVSPEAKMTYVPSRNTEASMLLRRHGKGKITPTAKEQAGALFAGHEGSEITEIVKSQKRGKTPGVYPQGRKPISGIPGPMSYQRSSGHASPRVILEEMRDARMLSPQVRRAFLKMRGGHMQLSPLPAIALQVPRKNPNQLYLPRHKLEKYTDKILKHPVDWSLLQNTEYPQKLVRPWKKQILNFVKKLR